MLTFGNASSGNRGLIKSRRFDNLVAAKEVMTMPRSTFFDADRTNPIPMETVSEDTMSFGSRMEQTTPIVDAFLDRDFNGYFLVHAAPIAYGTLRENRHQNARKAANKVAERPWWSIAKPELKKQPRRTRTERSDLYLEPNLDGEDKLQRYRNREVHRCSGHVDSVRTRNGKSWKSHGNKVFKVIICKPGEPRDVDYTTEYSAWHAEADHRKARKQFNASKKMARHENTSMTEALWLGWQEDMWFIDMIAYEREYHMQNVIEELNREMDELDVEYEDAEELDMFEYRELKRLESLYLKDNFCKTWQPAPEAKRHDDLDLIDAIEAAFDRKAA